MVRLLRPDRPRGRDYSSRREQWRLLLLILPLGFVIILMMRLRDPGTADRVNQFFAPPPIKPPAVSLVERRPVVAVPAPETELSLPPASPPGLHTDLLKAIQDNTYFRTTEKGAWFHFLELVKRETVASARAPYAEYVQLVDQPDVYRGKLVTVRGSLRQITQEKPADNDLGLTSYYRVMIQPADGANWPIIAYCLELPPGVSAADDLSLNVSVTGLFFKKLSYKWRDGLGIAPVIVAQTFLATPSPSGRGQGEGAAVQDNSLSSQPSTETKGKLNDKESGDSTADASAFQKILSLSGWDAQKLAKFDDGGPFSDDQRAEALQLLRRLRSIDSASLDAWKFDLPPGYELKNADDIRGELRGLVGRVTKVAKVKPPAAEAERLEMPEYFECELQLQNLEGPVTVLTSRVPNDWLKGKMQGAVSANALYLKQLGKETPPRSLWLAKEIAWYPGVPKVKTKIDDLFLNSRDPLLGKSLLGAAAMDVGLLDKVESRGRIRPQERDAFYKTLEVAGRIKPATLVRIAMENLPAVKQEWDGIKDGKRKALAKEVIRCADEGRYSVAMLFNDPAPQIGRLFVFDGVAKRAVRVEVRGEGDDGGSNDIALRFGINHYYELEVFTDDSRNYPLVFCVRDLPVGLPMSSDLHVPVRMAGFFFKDWLYGTRGSNQNDGDTMGADVGGRPQYAPLLIGRAPILLQVKAGRASSTGYILGGVFLLALAGIWAVAAWYARDDKRFSERSSAKRYAMPPGQSLNELKVPD